MKPLDITKISGEKLYDEVIVDREQFLSRAKEVSRLTIPSLIPPSETKNGNYPTPYQSLGARGLNNLSNKVVMSLFPPNNTFFKAKVPLRVLAEMGRTADDIKPAMAMVEQETIDEMEESGLRPKLTYAMQLAIASGNCLLHIPEEGEPRVFKLDSFGVKRDSRGNVLKLCIKECLNYQELPKVIQDNLPAEVATEECKSGKKPLDLYTCIIKHNDKYVTFQTIKNHVIKETRAEYNLDELEYLYIPFVDRGENYGRSFLEDYLGDLQSLEGLRRSTLELSAEAARIIYLVRPESQISAKQLQKAKSGDVLLGSEGDVTTIQQNKMSDLSLTASEAERLRQDLSAIMLLDSAVRRNAERVTAEEIRTVSAELEVALGGVYSTLSKTQKQIVKLYMKRCMKKGSIPKELKSLLKAEIITGTAALGRGTEFNTMRNFLGVLQEQLGPEIYLQYIKPQVIITKLGYSAGLNPTEFVKTDEELAMEQQQAMAAQQQQTMVEAAAPVAAQQALNNGE